MGGPLHLPSPETQSAGLEGESGAPSAAVGLAHSALGGGCFSWALLGLTPDELVTCPFPAPVPGRVWASCTHF